VRPPDGWAWGVRRPGAVVRSRFVPLVVLGGLVVAGCASFLPAQSYSAWIEGDTRPVLVTLADRLGVVTGMDAAGTQGWDGVANRGGDLRLLSVTWVGGACDERIGMLLEQAGDDRYRVTVETEIEPGPCREAGFLHTVDLRLSRPIAADSVVLFQRSSPAADPGG
jgi:hypothetical protein